jgi:hypothetical protein
MIDVKLKDKKTKADHELRGMAFCVPVAALLLPD